ncbi:MAG: DUF2274 domain-containing protein [Desulfurococcaceae archaeon]
MPDLYTDKKAVTFAVRLPPLVHQMLHEYAKIYSREVCEPRNLYTDASKIVRSIIVTLLMKKGFLGYEFAHLSDPCHQEYTRDREQRKKAEQTTQA